MTGQFALPGTFDDLAFEIRAYRPVVVGLRRTEPLGRLSHFVLVVGHDKQHERWLLADPDRGWQVVNRSDLDQDWTAAGHAMVVAFPRRWPQRRSVGVSAGASPRGTT